jgi:hypothetical protein
MARVASDSSLVVLAVEDRRVGHAGTEVVDADALAELLAAFFWRPDRR